MHARHRQEVQVLIQGLLLQVVQHIRGLRHVVILPQRILQTEVIQRQVGVRHRVGATVLPQEGVPLRTHHHHGRAAEVQVRRRVVALHQEALQEDQDNIESGLFSSLSGIQF